ncbi:hypothetical protein FFWV33_18905 [Flavobacterium faecale]|uniref:Uncharacterized protein n=1 Tax=Flavobacterium faecale TaxID=1355330 RepID=A0A2S1LI73_9FLAO|nr:hypothetical protein FFWV33_18905 [Flavobacterium faecale]
MNSGFFFGFFFKRKAIRKTFYFIALAHYATHPCMHATQQNYIDLDLVAFLLEVGTPTLFYSKKIEIAITIVIYQQTISPLNIKMSTF